MRYTCHGTCDYRWLKTDCSLLKVPGAPFTNIDLIFAWINEYMHSKVCEQITHQFPNFNGATINCTMEVITYSRLDYNWFMLVKGALVVCNASFAEKGGTNFVWVNLLRLYSWHTRRHGIIQYGLLDCISSSVHLMIHSYIPASFLTGMPFTPSTGTLYRAQTTHQQKLVYYHFLHIGHENRREYNRYLTS